MQNGGAPSTKLKTIIEMQMENIHGNTNVLVDRLESNLSVRRGLSRQPGLLLGLENETLAWAFTFISKNRPPEGSL